jgi:hypothetical protein
VYRMLESGAPGRVRRSACGAAQGMTRVRYTARKRSDGHFSIEAHRSTPSAQFVRGDLPHRRPYRPTTRQRPCATLSPHAEVRSWRRDARVTTRSITRPA